MSKLYIFCYSIWGTNEISGCQVTQRCSFRMQLESAFLCHLAMLSKLQLPNPIIKIA